MPLSDRRIIGDILENINHIQKKQKLAIVLPSRDNCCQHFGVFAAPNFYLHSLIHTYFLGTDLFTTILWFFLHFKLFNCILLVVQCFLEWIYCDIFHQSLCDEMHIPENGVE